MEKNQEHSEPVEPVVASRGRRSILQWIFLVGHRVFLSLFLFLFFLSLFLQFPFFQHWAVGRITHSLSQTLETRVEVGGFRLGWMSRLSLKEVIIEDREGDTLLYSKALWVRFDPNPITLFREGLVVNQVRLEGAQFNLKKLPDGKGSNLQELLNRLFPESPEKNKAKNPFQVKLKRLLLRKTRFTQFDPATGNFLGVYLDRGSVDIDDMNLPQKMLKVREISLRNPKLRVQSYFTDSLLPEETPEETPGDTALWKIAVEELDLRSGVFQLDNFRKEPIPLNAPGELNYRHLKANDIFLRIQDFALNNSTFSGQLENLALKEKEGFVLTRLASREVIIHSRGAQLNGMKLITPKSELGDTLTFTYRDYEDFSEFTDRVLLDGRFKQAQVAISDVITFAPALNEVPFFGQNRDELITLNGRIWGRVNNLKGSDLLLNFSDGSLIKGGFSSRNFALKNEEVLNLKLERFSSSVKTLRRFFPNVNWPANMDRLKKLEFFGTFDGFFTDFVAYGTLATDIGKARMDMKMVLREGKEKSRYFGNLELIDFDLGQWSNNPDLGKINILSFVKDGQGLNAETAKATLTAEIKSFFFKGYNYQNARLAGKLQANRFEGDFAIQDDNIDFSFLGQVDLTQGIPIYDFQAKINKLDLRPLNLIKKGNIQVSGDVLLNLRNQKFVNMEGDAFLRDFQIVQEGQTYRLDSADISTRFDQLGNKQFNIASDILNARFYGLFEVERIPAMLLQHLRIHFPGFSKRLGLNGKTVAVRPSKFDFDVEILNSKGFENLIDRRLGSLSGVKLSGRFDNEENLLKANLEMNWFQFDRFYAEDVAFLLDTKASEGSLDFGINRMVVNEKTELEPLAVLVRITGDTLDYGLNYARKNRDRNPLALDNLNIDGRLYVLDSFYLQNQIDYSEIELLGNTWMINQNNAITFNKEEIRISDFILTLDDKAISLESKGKRGLELSLLNLDISEINPILSFDPIKFSGRANVSVTVDDLMKTEELSMSLVSDTLFLNKQDWGILRVNAALSGSQNPLTVYVSLSKDTAQLIAEGYYNVKDYGTSPMQKAGYFDLNLNVHSYPLAFADFFIGETVSDMHGYFDADLQFNGEFTQPNTSGMIYLFDGGMTVDYLNTHYTLDRAVVKVNNTLFDASQTILRDRLGNQALVQGGIKHQHLKNFGFNARLTTNRLLGLETRKGQNNQFYGTAIGRGEVAFSGSFRQPDIYVNAEVGEGTRMVIPVSSDRKANSLNFISFVDKDNSQAAVQQATSAGSLREIKGVSFEMDLVANESALLQIIFNEQAGDIIEGNGRGALRITVPRNGPFQMFGDMIIERGEYLFTLYNVINKDFSIKRGGTITWTGDPYKAIIQIDAEYKDLYAPVGNFIQEYLTNASDQTRSEAAQNTDVDLTLKLQGDLLRPTINFDLGFPNLQGELLTYAENKLRLLKQDPNEMNKQVFGLIVAGQFLPADFSFQGSQIIYNTVSEFLSNQLSLLITELFSDLVGEGQALSSVDFDIAYNQYQSANLSQGGNLNRGNELQVSLRQNYFDNRLSILVGGNIDLGNNWRANTGATGAFIGNDVAIEYQLVDDRSLKLRIYQKLQPDISGRILQIGAGLSYRKEFDSFGEFLKSIRVGLKKPKPGPVPPANKNN